jgi:hypothetical protein
VALPKRRAIIAYESLRAAGVRAPPKFDPGRVLEARARRDVPE